jgi:hypothetical protein
LECIQRKNKECDEQQTVHFNAITLTDKNLLCYHESKPYLAFSSDIMSWDEFPVAQQPNQGFSPIEQEGLWLKPFFALETARVALTNRVVVDFAREVETGLLRMRAPLLHLHLASHRHSVQAVG